MSVYTASARITYRAERRALGGFIEQRMPSPLIEFRSPVIWLRTPVAAQDHTFMADGWSLREFYVPDRHAFNGGAYGEYQITLRRSVERGEDPGSVYIEGLYLVRAIDHMCVYATGRPLSSVGFQDLLRPQAVPRGWTSNGDAVIPAWDWRLVSLGTPGVSVNVRDEPTLPLETILAALTAYRSVDDVTAELAATHFAALTATSDDGAFLLFGRAVEMVRELLPGRDASRKEAALPHPVRQLLHRPLNWLFDLGNRRRNTRHPITKIPSITLHPDMTPAEAQDFAHDADLLIRHLVCAKLAMPFPMGAEQVDESA